ncbi:MAG: chemotaxis protein CheW [Sandaracinaceae bacterium]|nr:chemotaxis protein CheW [Sandaracinaceae bacterium]
MDVAVLPVEVAGRALAVEASATREVLGRCEITRVPGAPTGLAGVIAWRGRAVAVLDLGVLLGVAQSQERARTLVLEIGGHAIAIPVDRARESCLVTPRPSQVGHMPHARAEVEIEGRVLPLFDAADWLASLERPA